MRIFGVFNVNSEQNQCVNFVILSLTLSTEAYLGPSETSIIELLSKIVIDLELFLRRWWNVAEGLKELKMSL